MFRKCLSVILSLILAVSVVTVLPASAAVSDFSAVGVQYGPWSEWSTTPVSASSGRQVETRQVIASYDLEGNCCGNSSGVRCYLKYMQNGYTLRLHYDRITRSKSEVDSWAQWAEGSYYTYAANVNGWIIGPGTAYIEPYNCVPYFIVGTNYETQYRYRDVKTVNISDCSITLSEYGYTYDGTAKRPSVTVKYGTTTLVYDIDYTYGYSNNINAGTATVTIYAKGDFYTGSATKKFSINTKKLTNDFLSLSQTSYTYDGKEKRPTVTVKDGSKTLTNSTDYSVSYSDNINVGTAKVTVTGKGNYTGSVSKTFTITNPAKTNISNCTITLSQTSYTYDGKEKRPTVTVKDGTTTLVYYIDYTYGYSNNINAGTATVTIYAKGDFYTGSATKKFSINAKKLTNDFLSLSQTSYTYDGKEKRPTVTVKDGSKTLTNGTDYSVSYSDNINVGTAKVTVTGKGNYTGSVSKTFSIKAAAKKVFEWGKDNWNFNNSKAQGYFNSGTYRSQISGSYLNVLKKNLTNSEYQVIFNGTWYSGAWLDNTWSGSCYGMTSTALLSKQGLLPFANYKSGATNLHDLSYPKRDSNVSSLITYYQMLQVKDIIQQQYRTVPYQTNETNIKKIISLLNSNSTVMVGFQKSSWGGHAILATGYEYGSWTWNGVTYQGCIKICDPNASLSYNKQYNIYFNTQSYNWTIPAYSQMTSTNGAKFNYVGANVNEINKGGYLSGTTGSKADDFVARIDAAAISDNRSVSKVMKKNENYVSQNTAPGDIVEDYSYILGNASKGTIGYNLYDATASYEVKQDNAQNLNLTMDYDKCNLTGASKAGKAVLFDHSGYVRVKGESADYNIAMTFDSDYPTDWFTIQVKGTGANEASLSKEKNGYILKSDCLKNVTVSANNQAETVTSSFSTKYDTVFIYETSNKALGFKVDADNNGTYETVLKLPAPTVSAIVNTSSGVKLTWAKVAGAEKYRVFLKSGSKWTKLGDTASTTFVHKAAKSGKTYTYTVRCISRDGKSFTGAYNTKGWTATFIAQPALPTLKNTKSGVQITWNKVAGAAKYRVFRKTGNGKWTKLADTTALRYIDKRAKNGVTYRYTIRCISKDGKSFTSSYNPTGRAVKCKR